MSGNRVVKDIGLRVSGRVERWKIDRLILKGIETNPALNAYAGLTGSSLRLTQINNVSAIKPAINLVLPSLSAAGIFAGVKTAIKVGVELSRRLDRKIRLVSFSGPTSKLDLLAINRLLVEEFGLLKGEWELVSAINVNAVEMHENDFWIATYWTTAHALDVRCRLGFLDPNKVVYLIQDYEPSFLPASTDAFVALSTYRAGFIPLVNSSPLASALKRNAGLQADRNQVFAPQLDLARIEKASLERRCGDMRREILFYGRPSKPRNMFDLGISTLRSVTQSAAGASRWSFTSMGEQHRPVRLANGAYLRPLGSLSWSGYFERLAKAPILLSLQASPHPSHPPLDMVVSGGLAVTNEVDATRSELHVNLRVANADPDELAEKLKKVMQTVLDGGGANGFDPGLVSKLGVPLSHALEYTSKILSAG